MDFEFLAFGFDFVGVVGGLAEDVLGVEVLVDGAVGEFAAVVGFGAVEFVGGGFRELAGGDEVLDVGVEVEQVEGACDEGGVDGEFSGGVVFADAGECVGLVDGVEWFAGEVFGEVEGGGVGGFVCGDHDRDAGEVGGDGGGLAAAAGDDFEAVLGFAGEDGLEEAELFDGVDELVFGVVEGGGRVVVVVGAGVLGGHDEVVGVGVGELEVAGLFGRAGLAVFAHACDGRRNGGRRGVLGFTDGHVGRIGVEGREGR